ncbi:MAG: hypothetical protein K0R46_1806 [Herbinix sp.]|jgi:hypothetical protein|nr:hypothetical protein [Herbinix sp.]
MKLRYYMRGLGIGIILTTLILTIANPKERLTDLQIMERAKALGMVDAEDAKEESLREALENIKPTAMPTENPSEPTLAPSLTPTITPEPTSAPTLTPEPTPAPTPIIPEDGNTGGIDGENAGELVTFQVVAGMSSGKVAALLVDKGLVKDAEDFNKYIVKVGKASIIRVGTYTLPKGASYEEIMIMITSKK